VVFKDEPSKSIKSSLEDGWYDPQQGGAGMARFPGDADTLIYPSDHLFELKLGTGFPFYHLGGLRGGVKRRFIPNKFRY
jgi:hypothetical protein